MLINSRFQRTGCFVFLRQFPFIKTKKVPKTALINLIVKIKQACKFSNFLLPKIMFKS